MKSILALTLLLTTGAAHAEGTSTFKPSTTSESTRLGLGLTASYMNITSTTFKASSSGPFGSKSTEENGHEQLGMAGIRGSYRFDFKNSFSIDPGLTIMRSINKSEAENEISVVSFDSNFGWIINDSWTLFAGPALTRFEVANQTSDSSTNITFNFAPGAQIGIGYLNKSLLVRVGYADYGYSAEISSSSKYGYSSGKLDARLAGGYAQVGYMF